MDPGLIPALAGTIGLLGAALARWMDGRTKALQAELKNESDLLQTVIGRTHALEMQLTASIRREGQLSEKMDMLEKQLRDRELALKELTWRYEALRENYGELLERHKGAEAQINAMREELLRYYVRSGAPIPGPPKEPLNLGPYEALKPTRKDR